MLISNLKFTSTDTILHDSANPDNTWIWGKARYKLGGGVL